MAIRSEKDYILNLINQLKKVAALLLKKNIIENTEDRLQKIEEGLNLLNLSIAEIKHQKMEQIIAEHRNTEVLTLLNELLAIYLQHEPDEEIEKQKNVLVTYLHVTKRDYLFPL